VLTVIAISVRIATTRPITVRVALPHQGELVTEVYGTGTLESKVMIGVSSKITGKVAEVLADQGDAVTSGQVIARLESRDFSDAVHVAAAQRDQAMVELDKSRADLKRERALMDSNFVSAAEYDVFQTNELVAQAHLKTAEASLGVAQAKLKDTEIVSPIAGRVVARDLEIGSTIVPGAPIFRLAGSMPWLETMVDGRAVGKLRVGQPARVLFEQAPDKPISGHIARIDVEVDRVTEECEVDITLDGSSGAQILGQRADAFIETSRSQDVLQVPLTALVVQNKVSGIFVVIDGRATWRKIQCGMRNRENVEVLNGVSEGEPVIISPMAGKTVVSDGVRVAIQSAKAP